jgi:hypothetical protein
MCSARRERPGSPAGGRRPCRDLEQIAFGWSRAVIAPKRVNPLQPHDVERIDTDEVQPRRGLTSSRSVLGGAWHPCGDVEPDGARIDLRDVAVVVPDRMVVLPLGAELAAPVSLPAALPLAMEASCRADVTPLAEQHIGLEEQLGPNINEPPGPSRNRQIAWTYGQYRRTPGCATFVPAGRGRRSRRAGTNRPWQWSA